MAWLDEPWVRTLGYALAAVVSLAAGWRERRCGRRAGVWPTFWFLSAAVLGGMAVARTLDVDGLLTDLGRDEARDLGWYAGRRSTQAAVVACIGGSWTVTVGLALWLVPERRRRYLFPALVTFTIMCYSAVRLISLHQIDALLYRRQVMDVRIGTLVELGLLAVSIILPLLALGAAGDDSALPGVLDAPTAVDTSGERREHRPPRPA